MGKLGYFWDNLEKTIKLTPQERSKVTPLKEMPI